MSMIVFERWYKKLINGPKRSDVDVDLVLLCRVRRKTQVLGEIKESDVGALAPLYAPASRNPQDPTQEQCILHQSMYNDKDSPMLMKQLGSHISIYRTCVRNISIHISSS